MERDGTLHPSIDPDRASVVRGLRVTHVQSFKGVHHYRGHQEVRYHLWSAGTMYHGAQALDLLPIASP